MSKPAETAKQTNFIELKSEKQFKEILENHKFIAIDFTATWCGPCKLIGPEFEKLSKSHPSVLFVKIDVDTYSKIAQEYEVRAMPTFVFLEVNKTPKAKPEVLVGANKVKLQAAVVELSKKAALAAASTDKAAAPAEDKPAAAEDKPAPTI
ncbi:thioredoxin-domain-containing protein [Coemansia reversa NRRL 1564]|uniref:Thioredoxin-domain-containing protein n=1 Tax=Coemansia reversa (strain ATCC 12441 / NRRL 1564) TaxID=763665 RepID=A0A2G5B7J4_COERN|nr:thioredoxin-domain-containing protein [Coemansia reversa NRRL 1564]|eukprot:PIA14971.1 thioredoxin-domain-containing protein [Coemansia reversa NRRL 1564]